MPCWVEPEEVLYTTCGYATKMARKRMTDLQLQNAFVLLQGTGTPSVQTCTTIKYQKKKNKYTRAGIKPAPQTPTLVKREK